jgi:2-polyprenyl-3-methyl-5-hydroxy-6-metoxy-1,4-benzoquinol methylase
MAQDWVSVIQNGEQSMDEKDGFKNIYSDRIKAEAYAKLEFANTYHLAYRDIPEILQRHLPEGGMAIDFGCGTGRSSRFLKDLGFKVVGIDISEDMLAIAKQLDPEGEYHLVTDGNYSHLGKGEYDLVQCMFTFDNIPGKENRTIILKALSQLVKAGGVMFLLDSTPEMYFKEWASFSTKDYLEDNLKAKSGDIVEIITTDFEDRRPAQDIFWTEEDYHKMFKDVGMDLEATYKPLGRKDEPYEWVSEIEHAPWVIFVLRNAE